MAKQTQDKAPNSTTVETVNNETLQEQTNIQSDGLDDVATAMNTKPVNNDLSFLDDALSDLNHNIRTAKAERILGLGVYEMKVVGIHQQKFKNKKNQDDSTLVIKIDTGYTKMDSTEPRLFNVSFFYNGTFENGSNRDEALLSFMKRSFGIEGKITKDTFQSMLGKKIAVATKKDSYGYISYWYSSALKDLATMKNNYRAKDESNGQRPTSEKNIPETPPVIDPATGKPAGSDDLPY